MIKQFQGKYRFLSNFYPSSFVDTNPWQEKEGLIYPTVEHYFQAHKSMLESEHEMIRTCRGGPGQAKKLGRTITLRVDWEEIKNNIMWDALIMKFEQNLALRGLLLDTGNEQLQEGNWWGDNYWGIDLKTGKGKNMLGELLMSVREVLREE